ncbi:MAG: LPS assembly protein LptD, partial [Candidatus Omnitrophota bacterium]|nr:LPS assembly protein LptD [Candidatus Omnitrophota bacterium]
PEISLDVPALKIGSTRFYYQTDTSASNLYNRRAGLSDYEAIRFDSFNQFSYVGKLFNWLYFTPYVGARETWYSEDVNGETLNRAIFYSGISLNTTFWRIFDLETDFLGMEISGLRHLITPGISHNYRYKDPGLEQDKILDFDSIDEITGYNAVTFSLENKLQTKRKFGDETEKFDLADMIMSISYFPGTNKISDLEADLELRPYSWLTCRFDTSYSLDDETVETFNVDLIADGGDKWRFGLGNRYLRNEDNELTAQARYKLSPKWNVRGYQCWGYQGGDVMSTRLVEQEYGIERDLHCWTAELVWNRKDADTIWFVIRLKAFPQIEVKGRATYNEPEIGEHGSGY